MAGVLNVSKWVRRQRVAELLPWGGADGSWLWHPSCFVWCTVRRNEDGAFSRETAPPYEAWAPAVPEKTPWEVDVRGPAASAVRNPQESFPH